VLPAGALVAETAPPSLRNLAERPAKPRFQIADRVWPAKPGDAHLCLWKDDKLCAVSITIDDNTAPDHEWWAEQGKTTGFRFTWFVITSRVGTGEYWGTWEGFKSLRKLGHDVQSHTVTHLHPVDGKVDIEDEYARSLSEIEKNLPGDSCLTLAYPGGKGAKFNDRNVAARFYIAARGTRGVPNPANQIDYLGTNSVGGFYIDPPNAKWADFRALLDPALYGGRNYRGWYCTHFHGVRGEVREKVAESLRYIKDREADVWVGLFREVVQYGQERDTATLQVRSSDEKAVVLALSDRMDDHLFDFPLTVKVCLPDAWTAVKATQDGKPAAAALLRHDGAPYALVQVVPDRGDVMLNAR
jgi:hypothetical protein